jgi:hypothetical protein
MDEIDTKRPVRKFAGHLILGGVGTGVRAGIDADRDLTPLQKDVAKLVVSVLEGVGHVWVEHEL